MQGNESLNSGIKTVKKRRGGKRKRETLEAMIYTNMDLAEETPDSMSNGELRNVAADTG